MSIWFKHLVTDRYIIRQPELKEVAFVLATPVRGRKVIQAASVPAQQQGIGVGMVVADAKAVYPQLQVFDDQPELGPKLLQALAVWCNRYSPVVAVDLPDGLILDITGCAHLWGGERPYLKDIVMKLRSSGYDVRAAIADTIGAAWAVARYGQVSPIIETGLLADALLPLPPAALRLEAATTQRMDKLGMYQVRSFIHMQRAALRRRFGQSLLIRMDQALGNAYEEIQPVCPPQPYQERLPCLEPIRTAKGIEIALERLLEVLCSRLEQESKGLRTCMLRGYRVDGNIQQVQISTSRASRSVRHLFKLFEIKISHLEPDLGFELFLLEATVVEDLSAAQETLWSMDSSSCSTAVAELIDRLVVRIGVQAISRYLPDEHHWPERSITRASSLQEQPKIAWPAELPRPVHLLPTPEPIEVTVPLPDYPPMNFLYNGQLHTVRKADGPERIEQEWWIENNIHRDYYCVEDENGCRYWLFRAGSYEAGQPKWFVHGFFA